jgi:hypothetical protein
MLCMEIIALSSLLVILSVVTLANGILAHHHHLNIYYYSIILASPLSLTLSHSLSLLIIDLYDATLLFDRRDLS